MSARRPFRAYVPVKSWPFWGFHLFAIGAVIWSGWSWSGLWLALASYAIRMVLVTAGYHRYFSHRTFKTSRPMQLFLAVAAETSAQKGVLWWAAHHRNHHRYSDQEGDLHSALRDGFWWSHVGWISSSENDGTDLTRVKDLVRFPELRWLERWNLLPPFLLAVVLQLIGGWHMLLWGFFVPTVLLWHGSFTINSLSHMFGRRTYETTDGSRNNAALAVLTMGEGWHNNHHHYMGSANQGFRWWQIDVTFYVLRLMQLCGLVWDVRVAPRHIVEGTARARGRQAPAAPAAALVDNG